MKAPAAVARIYHRHSRNHCKSRPNHLCDNGRHIWIHKVEVGVEQLLVYILNAARIPDVGPGYYAEEHHYHRHMKYICPRNGLYAV